MLQKSFLKILLIPIRFKTHFIANSLPPFGKLHRFQIGIFFSFLVKWSNLQKICVNLLKLFFIALEPSVFIYNTPFYL